MVWDEEVSTEIPRILTMFSIRAVRCQFHNWLPFANSYVLNVVLYQRRKERMSDLTCQVFFRF